MGVSPMSDEQRTQDWLMARLGKITASRFSDVLTEPRSKADKEAGNLGGTATTYLIELITERLYGTPIDKPTTASMRWGIEYEAEAKLRALPWLREHGYEGLTECGFRTHPNYSDVGATPDFLIGEDGLGEVKCPANPVNHVKTLISGFVPDDYVAQVQGQLWVTGRQWCLFCSFDPRLADIGLEPLVTLRVARDNDFINSELTPKILNFRSKLNEACSKLIERLRGTK